MSRPGDSSSSSLLYYAKMKDPPAPAVAWSRAGTYFSWRSTLPENAAFGALNIFAIQMGNPKNPAILLIHGYPTSSWDFAELAKQLSRDFHVCALDTPGYGFSDKPRNGYRYSLFDDARLVDCFIREVSGLKSFTLVTHDKGDSVGLALLQIYQSYGTKPYAIKHHVITNGNIWLPLAHLSSMQKALLSPITGPVFSSLLRPAFLAKGMARAAYSPALGAGETAALASIFAYQDGTKVEHEIIKYLDERKANEAHWLETLRRSDIPTTVAWGEKDPIAPSAVADFVWNNYLKTRPALATYWRTAANHYIQHDQPAVLAEIIRREIGGSQDTSNVAGARLEDSVTP